MAQVDAMQHLEQNLLFAGMSKIDFVKVAVWALYHREQDKSYKGKLGPIPFSIKIKKLYPLLVHWFGPPPEGGVMDLVNAVL